MDQYPFEFNFFVAGFEVDDLINDLELAGWTAQAELCRVQFEKQMNEIKDNAN